MTQSQYPVSFFAKYMLIAQCYADTFFNGGGGGGVNFNISLILYFHFVIKFRILISICGMHFWCPLNLKMLPYTRLTSKYAEDDLIKMLEFLVFNVFVGLLERYSTGKIVPSTSWIRSIIIIINRLCSRHGKETVSISVQLHIQNGYLEITSC